MADPVCKSDALPTHQEKITMSTKVIAAIVALAFLAVGAGIGNRHNEYTYTFAQYCIPQFDELPGTTKVYC